MVKKYEMCGGVASSASSGVGVNTLLAVSSSYTGSPSQCATFLAPSCRQLPTIHAGHTSQTYPAELEGNGSYGW